MEKIYRLEDYVFEIHNFLDNARCDELIAHAEGIGFEDALITSHYGSVRKEDVRNNDRVISDDPVLAEELWQGLKPHMPATFRGRDLVGINERVRFYRYDPGQKFDWHQDGYYERDNGERSRFTFMVYLNDDFEGGNTSFCDVFSGRSFPDFEVEAKKGSALVFFHPVTHRGDEVVSGRKYVIRTDVMYSPLKDSGEFGPDER